MYRNGTTNGTYDTALTAAVARFQLWYGIRGDETGVYGNDTRAPGPVRDLSVTSLASVSGGGTVTSGLSIANFGVNAQYTNGAAQGSVIYDYHSNGLKVKSQSVSAVLSTRGLTLRWTAPASETDRVFS